MGMGSLEQLVNIPGINAVAAVAIMVVLANFLRFMGVLIGMSKNFKVLEVLS